MTNKDVLYDRDVESTEDNIRYSKYRKRIPFGVKFLDIYWVCKIFNVHSESGCLQHAIKKLLSAGSRGYKSKIQDLIEARDTIDREIEILTMEQKEDERKEEEKEQELQDHRL